jgi:hypothetical protein
METDERLAKRVARAVLAGRYLHGSEAQAVPRARGGGEEEETLCVYLYLLAGTSVGRALIAVVGITAIGGIAYATIPDSSGVIHSCYKKSGGAVRVIDNATTNCSSGETSLNWNVTGPPGSPGPPGPPGPAGVSGYEIVTQEQQDNSFAFFGGQSASCPTGKKVLGGGASALTADGAVQGGYEVLQEYPAGDSGWAAVFNIANRLGTSFILTTYAICATVS